MKKVFATIICLVSLYSYSQQGLSREDKRDLKDGDFAFHQGDYAFANDLLAPLYPKDSSNVLLSFLYGATLIELGQNTDLASRALNRAFRGGQLESQFYLGLYEHRSYRFLTAIDHFTAYQHQENKRMSDAEVDRYLQTSLRAMRMVAEPVDVKIENLGPTINTKDKEYVPLITADNETLYFTSRRANTTAQLQDPNGEYFEDIYYSTWSNGQWEEAKNIGQPINSETHDATVAISADGNTMITYRTNKNLSGGDLYISELKKGAWSKPKLLNSRINSNYQEASATISRDASVLFFSSNRPGGFGGKDIYRVKRLPNGEWSLPKNLGPMINSEFDEDAPFIDMEGKNLYFSSNGHNTMGGYDIFKSTKLDSEMWSQPENLGYPINTVEDDIYLTLDAGGKRGYFSSEREQGFGQLDIYRVDFIYRQAKLLVVKGQIMEASGNAVKAQITVLDEDSREVQGIYSSNENTGKYILVLSPLTNYKIFIEADGYKSQRDEVDFEYPQNDEFEFQVAPYILMKE